MKEDKEFQGCRSNLDCVIEILDENGNLIKESRGQCDALGTAQAYCTPSTTSKQWKNYMKAIREVRDGVKNNKVHQSFLMKTVRKSVWYPTIAYNSLLREKLIDLQTHNMDECIVNTLYVLSVEGSGFIKVSFTLIALLLFTIIA